MDLYSLTCPNCASTVNVEEDIDTLRCEHCGARLKVVGMDRNTLRAKVRLAELEHEERMHDAKYSFEREKLKQRDKENKRFFIFSLLQGDRVMELVSLVALMLIAAIIPAALSISSCVNPNARTRLENLAADVESSIAAGDYAGARTKALLLHLDGDYDEDEVSKWDEKRESYLDLIDDCLREEAANDSDTAFSPKSSKDLENMSGKDAKSAFEAVGFTNIEMIKVDGKAGFWIFSKKNKVEHIVFAGKTEFSTDDFAKKDAKITIFYYAE